LKSIKKPWIKLKDTIDLEDYYLVNGLREKCILEDKTTLKLELDYKLGITTEANCIDGALKINEFMYFDGEDIIGYIGISNFGGTDAPIEINGMVHPEFRGQGVFKKLWELVLEECRRRDSKSILLLCDRKSDSGQRFIKGTGAKYKHSEYEMYLNKGYLESNHEQCSGITLRKATNEDAYEIARQNAIYFNSELQYSHDIIMNNEIETTVLNEVMILPEEEEKRGMTVYLAEKDGQVIGKVHIQLISGVGGIFGLGVLPDHRRKGLGRAILMMAINKLREKKANQIMLQVATENLNALNLYKSCGFEETTTMDYYEIRLE